MVFFSLCDYVINTVFISKPSFSLIHLPITRSGFTAWRNLHTATVRQPILSSVILLISSWVQTPLVDSCPWSNNSEAHTESKSRMLAADKKTFHRQTKRRSAAGELQLRLKVDGDSNVSDFFWFFFLYFCTRKYLFIFPRSSSVVCFCFVRSWISHTASSSALTRAEPWEPRSNYTLRQNVLQKWHEKYVGHI